MISIFLSSTFQNMQHERDLIHKYVYPVVRSDAMRHGENLSIIDLRWGIDTSNMTSQEALERVLWICRDKVRASRPYFIALLGERYGSIINRFQETAFPEEISITEFEINECVSETPKHAFFFIRRDIDYSTYDPGQQKLIDRIIKDYPDRVVNYHLPDNESPTVITAEEQCFIRQVIERIRTYIDYAVSRKNPNRNYEGYIRERAGFLYGRDGIVSEVQKLFSRTGRQMLFLHGPVGIGKRSVLYRAAAQTPCRTVLIGSQVCACFTADAAADAIAAQVADLVDQIAPDSASYAQEESTLPKRTPSRLLSQVFRKYFCVENRPLVILVEDVDLLLKPGELRKFFNILESIQFPVKWCITGISEDCLQAMGNPTLWNVKRLLFLTEADRRSIISGIYGRNNKQLPERSLEALLEKQASCFPEYLQLVATLMNNFDRKDFAALSLRTNDTDGQGDVIAQNMRDLIRNLPEDTAALYHALMNVLQSQVPLWASVSIVEWLSYCPQGLREEDLLALTEMACTAQEGYSEIEFYLALRHLQQILSVSAQNVLRLRYPVQTELNADRNEMLRHLYIAYLEQLPQSDPIRNRDLLLQYIEADCAAGFTRELAAMGESGIRVPAEQLRTILTEHMPWMMQTIPQGPEAEDYDAVTSLIESCINFSTSEKQYGTVRQYLIRFFEAASNSTQDAEEPRFYRAVSMASLLASRNADIDMQAKWRMLSEKNGKSAFEKYTTQMPDVFQEVMSGLHNSISSMENLAEARSILDRGLPTVLCRYVLGKAEKNLEAVEDAIRRVGALSAFFAGDPQPWANLHELYGDCFRVEQNYVDAIAEYETSVDLLCSAQMQRHHYSDLHAILTKIGICHMRQNRLSEALEAYGDAVHSAEYVLEQQDTVENRVYLALIKCRIAEIYALQEDYKTAVSLLLPLNDLFENVSVNTPTVQSMQDYAVFCYKILKYEHCGRIDPARGIEYGQRAALLYMKLKQATGYPEYNQNAEECLRMIIELEEGTERK